MQYVISIWYSMIAADCCIHCTCGSPASTVDKSAARTVCQQRRISSSGMRCAQRRQTDGRTDGQTPSSL